MPTLLRNPFRKQDENLRPPLHPTEAKGSRDGRTKSSELSVDDKLEPVEYKLSEISDNGAYLPPSPPLSATDSTRRSFWATSTTSSRTSTSTSNNHRALLSGNKNGDDQFSISRESFESYRRSFDISARSPVRDNGLPRQSLDSRTFLPPPRTSAPFDRRPPLSVTSSPAAAPPTRERNAEPQQKAEQDVWEDVDIGPKPTPPQPREKKRGLFSRITEFGDSSNSERPPSADGAKPSSGPVSATWHHFSSIGGRKRGQSGQGSELGALPVKKEGTGMAGKEGSGLKKAVTTPSKEEKKVVEEKKVDRTEEGKVDKAATYTLQRDSPAISPSAPQNVQATAGAPVPAPKSEAAEIAAGKSDSAIDVPGTQAQPPTEEMQEVSLDDTPKPAKTTVRPRAPEVQQATPGAADVGQVLQPETKQAAVRKTT